MNLSINLIFNYSTMYFVLKHLISPIQNSPFQRKDEISQKVIFLLKTYYFSYTMNTMNTKRVFCIFKLIIIIKKMIEKGDFLNDNNRYNNRSSFHLKQYYLLWYN